MRTETVLSYKSPLGNSFEIIKQIFSPFSGKPVKRISLVAGLHGDELEGVYLCSRLILFLSELEKSHPKAFKGQINIYPAVNPQAINDATRLWSFFSKDMNRQFNIPGKTSLPTYATQKLLQDLISCSDLAVDLHAGNLHLHEIPQIRIIENFDKKLIPLARNCNMDLIWVHPMAEVFESTLSYNLNQNKIPTLVVEAGTGLRLTSSIGEQIFSGMVHLLHHIGVIESENSGRVKKPLLVGPSQVGVINVRQPGLFISQTILGKKIKKEEKIGDIVDPLQGTILEEVFSPYDGLVFSLRELPLSYSNAILARIALEKGSIF